MPGCPALLPALPRSARRTTRPSILSAVGGLLLLCGLALPTVSFGQETAPPRVTTDGEKEWSKKYNFPWTKALKVSQPSGQEKDLVISGAKHFVDRLTNPDNASRLLSQIDPFLTILYGPGTSAGARAIVHQALVDHCRELLTANPPYPEVVNTNLVILLGKLYAAPANTQKQTPAVPLVATIVPLQAVLNSEILSLPPKIRAAETLGTVALNAVPGVQGGDLSIREKDGIVADLLKALKSKAAEGKGVGPCWYRESLVEALGNCDLPLTLAGLSAPIDAMMDRLVDRQEDLQVRGAAARAISQCKLNNTYNLHLIVHETAIFHLQLALEYNATPVGARTGAFKWGAAYGYFAFKPQNPTDATARGWGFLTFVTTGPMAPQAGLVNGAFQECLKVTKALLSVPVQQTVPGADITTLRDWLTKNPPASRKVTPKSPDIPAPDKRAAYDPPAAPANPAKAAPKETTADGNLPMAAKENPTP